MVLVAAAFTGASTDEPGLFRRPAAEYYYSMRSARCRLRCRPGCCACCRRGDYAGRTRARRKSMCVCPPPIAISVGRWRQDLPRGSLLPARGIPDPAATCATAARTFFARQPLCRPAPRTVASVSAERCRRARRLMRFRLARQCAPVAERNRARGRALRRCAMITRAHLWAAVAGRDEIALPGGAAGAPPSVDGPTDASQPLAKARADFEARYIASVLARAGGNVTQAARILGISRVALHKRIKQFPPG